MGEFRKWIEFFLEGNVIAYNFYFKRYRLIE